METKTVEKIDVKQFTPEQQQQLLKELRENERREKNRKTEAYEGIRTDFIRSIFNKVRAVASDVEALHAFVEEEATAFKEIMADYGQLRRSDQRSFRIQDGNLRLEVSSQKVKKFDERADLASTRLIDFLQNWMEKSPKGSEDQMYQLAMLMLERNKQGELDYKNISYLYQMEPKFNDVEYTEIMELFRESHVVDGTATRYYFWEKDKNMVWKRIEVSFNKM